MNLMTSLEARSTTLENQNIQKLGINEEKTLVQLKLGHLPPKTEKPNFE